MKNDEKQWENGGGAEEEAALAPSAVDTRAEQRHLQKIWSRRMALLGLKRIYLAALEGARTEIRDGDGALVEVKFNPTAATAATKAIEVANRMLGYTTPDEGEGEDTHLTVSFAGEEELAK